MRFDTYLTFLGSENAVRDLCQEIDDPDAVVEHLDKVSESASPTGMAAPWCWRAPRVAISTHNPGADVQRYLEHNRTAGLAIATHSDNDSYASLVIVAQYGDTDTHRGIFLSSETIALMGRYRLAFDLDAVQLMDQQ